MKNTENQEIESEIIEEQENNSTLESDTLSEEQTEQTATESVDWQDRYIRLAAEFDNYRKRTLKEKAELIQNGGVDIIKIILPALDDFDRALPLIKEAADKEGMTLVYQNLANSLKSKGVTEIESTGKPFDVDFHEAVAKIPATEDRPGGIIIDTIQKGYTLKDKVIRFAKVVVAE